MAGKQDEFDVPAGEELARRVKALVDRGLLKYGRGDLEGALSEWEHALALDATLAVRADEYIRYVRENFELLDEQFRQAKEAAARLVAEGLPVPEDDDGEDVSGAYDLIQLDESSEPKETRTVTRSFTMPRPRDLPSWDLAEGWELDADEFAAAPLPPPPVEAEVPKGSDTLDEDLAAVQAGLEMVPGQAVGEAPALDDEEPGATIEIDAELPPQEAASAAEPPAAAAEEPADEPDDADDEMAEEPTTGHHKIITIHPRRDSEPVVNIAEPAPGESLPVEEGLDLTFNSASPEETSEHPTKMRLPQEVTDEERATTDFDPGPSTAEQPTAVRLEGPPRAEPQFLGDEELKTTERQVFADEMPTIERGAVGDGELPDLDLPDLDLNAGGEEGLDLEAGGTTELDFDDASATRERPSFASIIVDEALLKTGEHPTAPASPGTGPQPAEAGRPSEDDIKARMQALLEDARRAADAGDFDAAVAAAEDAAAADPEGSVGPLVLHRHRDLLYRVYEGHIGDIRQIPQIVVPMHEITQSSMDPKTGFLLSRIDGMLSVEDILDVAGMPRLDAYRILSNLLRRGYIKLLSE